MSSWCLCKWREMYPPDHWKQAKGKKIIKKKGNVQKTEIFDIKILFIQQLQIIPCLYCRLAGSSWKNRWHTASNAAELEHWLKAFSTKTLAEYSYCEPVYANEN